MSKATIIGATSWGTTIGVILARKGVQVSLWVRSEEEGTKMANGGPGSAVLADITLPAQLSITESLDEAIDDTDAVIMAVPAQTMRHNIRQVADYLKKSMLIVSAAKGIEIETGKRMSEVIAEEIDPRFHSNICVLSGPNLAREVVLELPAASVVAAADASVIRKAHELLTTPNFCVYTNTDVIGVELGGALKNIIALGAGIMDGLGYGDNAKSAFITRGLTEITALGVALGASPLTFSGLAGLGDLMATCASVLSRNHYVGVELAKGRPLMEITESMDGVAEGVATTKAVWYIARRLGLGMPITEKMYQVLYDAVSPSEVAAELMGAQGRHELAGRKWRLFSRFRHRK
ncbi:MAG: NAD(P)-dependent glycerol-3-phosphate dehydrogenase [Chloroflexi bacterium]|nr:NAD(P)-dependent glycerol-3-phosphate dehydrogenase [Chloroflexota bacterium]